MHFLAVALHCWFILLIIHTTLRSVFAVFLSTQDFTSFVDVCFLRIIFYISHYCFFLCWFLDSLSNLSIAFEVSDLILPSVCIPCHCFEVIRFFSTDYTSINIPASKLSVNILNKTELWTDSERYLSEVPLHFDE